MLYDSRDDPDHKSGRIIMFGTKNNLNILMKSPNWFADGTFKVAPTIFYQLFTILCSFYQVTDDIPQVVALPMLFVLMEDKKEESYTKIFSVIKMKCQQLGVNFSAPFRIMTDFELAVINATKEVFGDVIQGCFFHLRQCIFRRIQLEGLQQAHNDPEDNSVKVAAQMVCALAFVPVEDVEKSFDLLFADIPESFICIAEYFEVNYVRGRPARGRRRGTVARYLPSLWNQYECILQNLARTNNLSEGWHNRFQLVVGRNHPSPYAFFSELQTEQGDTETMIRELELGRKLKKGQERSRKKNNERIRNIVNEYEKYKRNDEILKYLKTIGYYINL